MTVALVVHPHLLLVAKIWLVAIAATLLICQPWREP